MLDPISEPKWRKLTGIDGKFFPLYFLMPHSWISFFYSSPPYYLISYLSIFPASSLHLFFLYLNYLSYPLIPPSLPLTLLPSLPPFLVPSLPLTLLLSLPPSYPPSLPLSLLPSLPPSLSLTLPPSYPHSLLLTLTPSQPPSLPHTLYPSPPSLF